MQFRVSLNRLRCSPDKANLVAKMIRGMNAMDAYHTLKFTRKKVALDIAKLVGSGIANAEDQHGIEVDDLVVQEAYVGKSLVLKRMMPRAKGRGDLIQKKFCHITLVFSDDRARMRRAIHGMFGMDEGEMQTIMQEEKQKKRYANRRKFHEREAAQAQKAASVVLEHQPVEGGTDGSEG